MNVIRGWAKYVHRATPRRCTLNSNGLSFSALGQPPRGVSLTFLRDDLIDTLEVYIDNDADARTIMGAMREFLLRRNSAHLKQTAPVELSLGTFNVGGSK